MSPLISAALLGIVVGQLHAGDQLPVINARNFPPAVQKDALLATVRIVNVKTKKLAVGVVLQTERGKTYILTAAHVAEGVDELNVHVFTAESYPLGKIHREVKVIARGKDRQPDLAVLCMAGYDGDSKGMPLCPLKDANDKNFSALAIGSGKELAPTLRLVTVNGSKMAKKSNDLRAIKYFENLDKALQGESGGPLVNTRGELLGICSGTNNGDKGYYTHVEEIRTFLSNNGLKSLLKQP